MIPFLLLIISYSSSSLSESKKGPFFWQVEKDGRVHHILGTIHYGVALQDLQCSEEISQSLLQSDLVWTEINENLLEQKFKSHMESNYLDYMDLSRSHFQSLNPESQKFFQQEFFKEQGFTVENYLSKFKYLFLNTLVFEFCADLIARSLSPNNKIEVGLDFEVEALALNKNIQQDFLDRNSDMGALLTLGFPKDLISKEAVERNIKYLNENCLLDQKEAETIKADFISGNFPEDLDPFNSEDRNEYIKQGWSEQEIKKIIDSFNNELLKNRNEVWLNELVSANQQTNKMFIAGGLTHFVEDHNVLGMLKREGFTIKRYSSACVPEESY